MLPNTHDAFSRVGFACVWAGLCVLVLNLSLLVGCRTRSDQSQPPSISETTAIQRNPPAPYELRAHRLLNRFQEEVNVEIIRAWAKAILLKHRDLPNSTEVKREDVLPLLDGFFSEQRPLVFVYGDDRKHDQILVTWGGGFGHYGLAIGTEESQPKSDDFIYLMWVPGVFVFHSSR